MRRLCDGKNQQIEDISEILFMPSNPHVFYGMRALMDSFAITRHHMTACQLAACGG